MKTFAVLQLAGCAGCEVSLLNADEWVGKYRLAYMPLVISTHDVPEVDLLLVSGGVRNEEDLYSLRRAVPRARKVIAIGTCAISGGLPLSATGTMSGSSSCQTRNGITSPIFFRSAAPSTLSCRLTAISPAARLLPSSLWPFSPSRRDSK
jgi:coenzyme F420-reducing hydrogenase gamma subunit